MPPLPSTETFETVGPSDVIPPNSTENSTKSTNIRVDMPRKELRPVDLPVGVEHVHAPVHRVACMRALLLESRCVRRQSRHQVGGGRLGASRGRDELERDEKERHQCSAKEAATMH